MAQAKTLTEGEIQKLLDHIATKPNAARNRVMFLLTVWAGLRVSEVAALKLSDVRNKDGSIRGEIYLDASRVKHGHAGVVFLNARLQGELDTYIRGKPWFDPQQSLFTTQARPRKGFTANTMTQTFYYLYRGAGIQGASSHSLRRTFITNLASRGIGVRVLASLAGHQSISVTQRYIDVNDDMKRRAVELV
ncbi:MAG: site-specific integrase [Betaproteobacteria bacterium]|nr:site-specific integrase [Betaproteobacteria bacterium]NDB14237.1 site-specific integrase [Betaproteobacteria bacterium]